MQFNKLPKFVTISAESDEELDYKIDAATRKMAKQGKLMEIHWHLDKALHVTLVFEVTHVVTETLQEEYEEKGLGRMCMECKHYKPSTDGRVKYTRCEHSSHRVWKEMRACEYFYEQLEKGEDIEVLIPDRPIRLDSARRMINV